ncbi:MAG: ABC transporter ATP-binding protein [Promethearchaeota archaeon]
MSGTPIIQLKNLSKSYSIGRRRKYKQEVLKGLNWALKAGDFVTIHGPSGSGKTTLLNILGFLDLDYSGTFLFKGRDARGYSGRERQKLRLKEIGFIFQTFNLIDSLTAIQNIQYPLALLNYPRKKQKEIAIEMLTRLGIIHRKKAYPSELSSGERQRVAIARALVKDPTLILADEPTGDLDQENTRHFIEILKDQLRDWSDITTIIVSHDPAVINVGRKKFKLVDGRLFQIEGRLKSLEFNDWSEDEK